MTGRGKRVNRENRPKSLTIRNNPACGMRPPRQPIRCCGEPRTGRSEGRDGYPCSRLLAFSCPIATIPRIGCGGVMKRCGFGIALAVFAAVGPAVAQQVPDPITRDLWSRYTQCASDYLVSVALTDPNITFDQRELSIRTACGHHVDALRAHFARAGLSRQAANRIIGDAYRELAPGLRTTHETTAVRVQASRAEAARAAQERAREAERVAQDRTREAEADRERQKVFTAAGQEHRKCVTDAVVDLLLSSSEGAEAIATAAMARCSSHEARRVQLGMAMYRVDRDFATKAIGEDAVKIRTEAIAAVVEIRAAANRARQGAPRDADEPQSPRQPDRPT